MNTPEITCRQCQEPLVLRQGTPPYWSPRSWNLKNAHLDTMCLLCVARLLYAYDSAGDGAAVNALCAYGRGRFGQTLYW